MKSGVERFFAWLTNGFRRLAIRWERLTSTFTGFIQLACIIIYLRVFRWVRNKITSLVDQ
jgi:transposase